jgi:serine/threonine protein phosphatase PrpC
MLETSFLTRALGTEEDVLVDSPTEPLPVRHGDHFVLCSDGLSRMVLEQDVARIVSKFQPAAACEKLVELAIGNGSLDNVTVEIVRVDNVTVEAPNLWQRLLALFRGQRPLPPKRRTTSQIVVARSTPHTRRDPEAR